MDLNPTYHPIWLLLGLAIALFVAVWMYRKNDLLSAAPKSAIWAMGALRFLSTFLLFFLLLGWLYQSKDQKKEKPILFLAHDNSASVIAGVDSMFYRQTYLEQLKGLKPALSEKFELIEYSFSDGVQTGLVENYQGKSTDISAVLDQIYNQYSSRNIGGIILSSDGIYNKGANPIYVIQRKSYVPVFTIGLGDTNEVKDLKVIEVKHNEMAFLGNDFPVQCSFQHFACQGQNTQLRIIRDGKVIHQQNYLLDAAQTQVDVMVNLKADKIGIQKYTVELSEIKGEYTIKNNVADFYVDVVDGRQKILLAYSGPHPDIGAFNFVIDQNKNYEAVVMPISDISSTAGYDLIVVHSFQPSNAVLNKTIENGATPLLFINGLGTDMAWLKNAQLGFSGSAQNTEELSAVVNTNFKDILLSDKVIKMISQSPPLHAPFGNLSYSSALEVLAWQKIGNIQLNSPLIYFTKKSGTRLGVIMGEGMWRWRLYDQLKNNGTKNFEEFIGQLVNYLAVKENKDPFKIHLDYEYNENEEVIIKAELYNQSYELVEDGNIQFNYENEAGKVFESYFSYSGNQYVLNLGRLPKGLYSWKAIGAYNDKKYEKEGSFIVNEIRLEMLNIQANHGLLQNMSQNTGGQFYLPTQTADLTNDLLSRDDMVTVVYEETSFKNLIDYKWIAFFAFLLLAIEWGLRKYHGAY